MPNRCVRKGGLTRPGSVQYLVFLEILSDSEALDTLCAYLCAGRLPWVILSRDGEL